MRRLAKLGLIMMTGLVVSGLGACGAAETVAEQQLELVASAEAEALSALGIADEDIVAAEPAMAAADGTTGAQGGAQGDAVDGGEDADHKQRLKNWRKRHALRVALRRNVMHGEAVVQTKNGPVTVLVQRGEVTAVDDKSVTVKSADGYTQTWLFGEKLRVVEKRQTITPQELAVGAKVALAGMKNDGTVYARLIIIPVRK